MKKNLLYLGLTGYLLFALCTRLQAQTDSLQAHRYVTRATCTESDLPMCSTPIFRLRNIKE